MDTDLVLRIVLIGGGTIVLTLLLIGAVLYASSRSARDHRRRQNQQGERFVPSMPSTPPPLPRPRKRIEFGSEHEVPAAQGKIQWGSGPARMRTDPMALRCPVCRQPVTGEDCLSCPSCDVLYHRGCWEYVSGVCPNCREV